MPLCRALGHTNAGIRSRGRESQYSKVSQSTSNSQRAIDIHTSDAHKSLSQCENCQINASEAPSNSMFCLPELYQGMAWELLLSGINMLSDCGWHAMNQRLVSMRYRLSVCYRAANLLETISETYGIALRSIENTVKFQLVWTWNSSRVNLQIVWGHPKSINLMPHAYADQPHHIKFHANIHFWDGKKFFRGGFAIEERRATSMMGS